MALGTATHNTAHSSGKSSNTPDRFDVLTFAGDGTYAAGGTPNFEAFVQAALSAKVTVISVETLDTLGYVHKYDITNDKLMVFFTNAAGGVLIEDTTANQSARNYIVGVRSK